MMGAILGRTYVNWPGIVITGAIVVAVVVMILRSRAAVRARPAEAAAYASLVGGEPALPPHAWRAYAQHSASADLEVSDAQETSVEGTEYRVFGCMQQFHVDRSTYRMYDTRAALHIPATCPRLVVTARNSNAYGHVVPIGGTIRRMESADFNAMYVVEAPDERLAFAFLDGAMMEWLLAQPRLQSLECSGDEIVVSLERDATERVDHDAALRFVVGVRRRLPDIVLRMWAPAAAEGTN